MTGRDIVYCIITIFILTWMAIVAVNITYMRKDIDVMRKIIVNEELLPLYED